MLTLIQLPEGMVASSLAYSGQLFDDFSPFIFLAMGMAIAFAVVNAIRGKSPDEKEDELL
jgi:D-alanyl-lipoteichoic acid acyltransferase DltB (MBOAT superfamily)